MKKIYTKEELYNLNFEQLREELPWIEVAAQFWECHFTIFGLELEPEDSPCCLSVNPGHWVPFRA